MSVVLNILAAEIFALDVHARSSLVHRVLPDTGKGLFERFVRVQALDTTVACVQAAHEVIDRLRHDADHVRTFRVVRTCTSVQLDEHEQIIQELLECLQQLIQPRRHRIERRQQLVIRQIHTNKAQIYCLCCCFSLRFQQPRPPEIRHNACQTQTADHLSCAKLFWGLASTRHDRIVDK